MLFRIITSENGLYLSISPFPLAKIRISEQNAKYFSEYFHYQAKVSSKHRLKYSKNNLHFQILKVKKQKNRPKWPIFPIYDYQLPAIIRFHSSRHILAIFTLKYRTHFLHLYRMPRSLRYLHPIATILWAQRNSICFLKLSPRPASIHIL